MTKREYLETGLRQEMTTAGVDAVIGVSPENGSTWLACSSLASG